MELYGISRTEKTSHLFFRTWSFPKVCAGCDNKKDCYPIASLKAKNLLEESVNSVNVFTECEHYDNDVYNHEIKNERISYLKALGIIYNERTKTDI